LTSSCISNLPALIALAMALLVNASITRLGSGSTSSSPGGTRTSEYFGNSLGGNSGILVTNEEGFLNKIWASVGSSKLSRLSAAEVTLWSESEGRGSSYPV